VLAVGAGGCFRAAVRVDRSCRDRSDSAERSFPHGVAPSMRGALRRARRRRFPRRTMPSLPRPIRPLDFAAGVDVQAGVRLERRRVGRRQHDVIERVAVVRVRPGRLRGGFLDMSCPGIATPASALRFCRRPRSEPMWRAPPARRGSPCPEFLEQPGSAATVVGGCRAAAKYLCRALQALQRQRDDLAGLMR